jgi:hypothetical protein
MRRLTATSSVSIGNRPLLPCGFENTIVTSAAPQRLAAAAAAEDHIGHFRAAQVLDLLLAQDPLDRIDTLLLPQPLGPVRP